MLKKLIAFTLVLTTIFTFSVGCNDSRKQGTTDNKDATTTHSEGNEEPAKLVIAFITGSNLTDLQKVNDAINEITREEINAEIELKQLSWANFTDQFNLMLASTSEQLDLMPVMANLYPSYVATGKLQNMTSAIEQFGQDIVKNVGEQFIAAGQVEGKQYGVPAIMGWPSSTAFVVRKDKLDLTGYDINSIKKVADITPILQKITELDSESLPPLVPESGYLEQYKTYDPLNDSFGVLLNYGNNLDVVNWFETQEYADLVSLMHEWNQAGYIMPDAEITQDVGSILIKNGAGYGMIRNGSPGAAEAETMTTGHEMVQANICEALSTTASVIGVQWSVPVNSKNVDKAVEMLNLMYSDERIANLLAWGIEGTHYVKNDDGTIGYPEGMTADTSPYMPNTAWQMGNQFITHVWEGNAPDYNEQLKNFNESSNVSKALGFLWDPTNVTTEITAVSNVASQYRPALECGAVDPEEVLPQFIEALKDAGIDRIIEEKQTQLDNWAAANGID